MTERSLADSRDWNRFWQRPVTDRYGRISWSKQRIISFLKPYLAPKMAVLDAGCGSGFFSAWFADQGCDVTALDYSTQALRKAREALGDRGRCLEADLVSGEGLDASGQKYDLIFSDGLLEHFSAADQDRILTHLRNVLTEKGKIVTCVPNVWSPWQLVRPFVMPGIQEKPFILQSLVEVHVRNGLRVMCSGGLNVLPFRISPEILGSVFGMIVYVVTEKNTL